MPSRPWRSGVPWESPLVFLDRHASISQAKGTVNLPRKWAPLSKPASLCFLYICSLEVVSSVYFGPYRSFQAVVMGWLHSSGRLSPRAPAPNAVCILTALPQRRSLRPRRCTLMNGRPCPSSPSPQVALSLSSERESSEDQLCDILQKENSHYLDQMQSFP